MEETDIRTNPHVQSEIALSNSDKYRQRKDPPAEREKRESVVGNVAVKRKKSSKFLEIFRSTKDYILEQILIPTAKEMLNDAIANGASMLIFGDARGSRRGKRDDRSYASYYRRDDRRDDRVPLRDRRSLDFDNIVLEIRSGDDPLDIREKAEKALSDLTDLTFDYGSASAADLYDLVGISAVHTDELIGWYKGDLRSATVRRVRDGYLIDLPKPVPLR